MYNAHSCSHKWKIHYNIAFRLRPPRIIVTIRLVVSETYFIKGKFVDFWHCIGSAVYTFGAVSFVQINRKAKKKK